MNVRYAVAIIGIAALLGAAPSFAAPKSAEPEVKAEQRSSAEVKTATSAKMSVPDAIAVAEKHSNGGKVLEVSFDAKKGATYALRTYQNHEVWEGSIDANSGQLLGPGKTTPESKLDAEDKAELAGLEAASTTLADAVRAAEQRTRGRAISAGLEDNKGGVVWEVVVASNGKARKVVIDPKTGQARSS
jgi:uncharacterized membrane protein YkoI